MTLSSSWKTQTDTRIVARAGRWVFDCLSSFFIILGIFLALLSPLVVSGEEPENIEEFGRVFGLNGLRPLMLAAFVVHLWLPLFAVCVVFLRALNYLRLAVGGVQWFVKKGREHPLDAIGYVAAGLVFVITVAIQRIL